MTQVNIMTWNVNSLRKRLSRMKEFLIEQDVDIACLQETKLTRSDHIDDIKNYKVCFRFSGRRGYSGTATYCKETIELIQINDLRKQIKINGQVYPGLRKQDEGRCIITHYKFRTVSEVSTIISVAIVNVYIPRTGRMRERLEYRTRLLNLLRLKCRMLRQQRSHIVLLGDFNLTHRKKDSVKKDNPYLNEFRLPARTWFNEMLVSSQREPSLNIGDTIDNGFLVDVYRHCYSKKKKYTNWHMRSRSGRRIDYILVDKELLRHVQDCRIISKERGSDHCPVILTLNCTPIFNTELSREDERNIKLTRQTIQNNPLRRSNRIKCSGEKRNRGRPRKSDQYCVQKLKPNPQKLRFSRRLLMSKRLKLQIITHPSKL